MKLCWKFYGNINFKVVLLGLWLSFSALNGAEADCNYFQNLEAGQTYYAYNPNYPEAYMGENHCAWQMESPYVTRINCTIEMPYSNNCIDDKLTIKSEEKNDVNLCGYGNYVFEGTNPTIRFDSSYGTEGGRFLCEIQTEKEWDKYNCDCGWKKVTRIIGGKETGVNEYPMMCGLVDSMKEEREMIYCGCTIISQQYIITAAHCAVGKDLRNKIGVVVGEHNVTTDSDTSATKLFRLKGCIIHPLYNDNGTNARDLDRNDIAVCKIDGNITYSAEIGPACLPFQHNRDSFGGDIVTALGWGLTEFAGYKPTALRGVNLNVMALEKCRESYPDITDSDLCTFTEGKDTCQMDSGGPLLWEDPTTKNQVLIGITSAGTGCASNKPAVAMRVGAYIDWIIYVTPDVQYCQVE